MCKLCVLFPQHIHRGTTGAFISNPCKKYNDFRNSAPNYVSSAWHRHAQKDANKFLTNVKYPGRRVESLLDNAFNSTVANNRAKLVPILSNIIFCGTRDTLHTIAKYSYILETVNQALQAVQLDMLGVKQHVDKLISMFSNHRQNAGKVFA